LDTFASLSMADEGQNQSGPETSGPLDTRGVRPKWILLGF